MSFWSFLNTAAAIPIIISVICLAVTINLIIAVFKIRNNTADTADLLEDISKQLQDISFKIDKH